MFGDLLEQLIKKEVENPKITYKVNYFDYPKYNYIKEPGDVGLELIDRESNEKSSKVMAFLIKSLGKNFLAGNELTNVSMPIFINDERTLLEITAYRLINALDYLVPAADAMKIERMKLMTCFLISNISHNLYGYKPFNPILGETFQCDIKSNTEGISNLSVYCEQTSHHPPILNYYASHELFKIYGYRGVSIKGGTNSIESNIKGETYIKYNDGTCISFHYGDFLMTGILVGQRKVNFTGNFVIKDETNRLISFFEINPKEKKSFIGNLFSKTKENFPDYYKGYIASLDDAYLDPKTNLYTIAKGTSLAEYDGEYTSHLNFDGKLYWSIENKTKCEMIKQKYTLQSDSRLRSDLILYKNKNEELAECAKSMLENIQRKDRNLRKKNK